MCLVKTLLGKPCGKKILVKEKEYTYLLIRIICCLIKNLARKTQWKKNSVKEKRVRRVLYSLIKTSLNFFVMMSPIFVHCGWYILFQRKTTHFQNMVYHLSQPDALSTWFMEDFYFCIATFALLIDRILLNLHMKTNSMFEIGLYAVQINILHLHN